MCVSPSVPAARETGGVRVFFFRVRLLLLGPEKNVNMHSNLFLAAEILLSE